MRTRPFLSLVAFLDRNANHSTGKRLLILRQANSSICSRLKRYTGLEGLDLSEALTPDCLFLSYTFCLSFQKKESKYNPTAGHHVIPVIDTVALPREELPFYRLNGPIYLYSGSLYSWWG
jgi:hypothetical protein